MKKDELKAGDVVMIRNVPDKYKNQLEYGDYGIIQYISGWADYNDIVIKIEHKPNVRSTQGVYYLNFDDIRPLKIKDEKSNTIRSYNMKRKHLLKGYKVAMVVFCTTKFDELGLPVCDSDEVPCALYDDIGQDEHVLCSNGTIGFIQRIIEDVDDVENVSIEIICKVDYEKYKQRQEKLCRIEEVKRKMQKKKEELNELAIYEALAKSSPEMAEMLKELKELL